MNTPAIEPGPAARVRGAPRRGRGLSAAALALVAGLGVKMAGVGGDIAWLMAIACICGCVIGALLTLEFIAGDRADAPCE